MSYSTAQANADRIASTYGVYQTGTAVDHTYHSEVDHSRDYTLSELAAAGGRVSRVRLLTDSSWGYKMADVSYIHCTLPDGSLHPVNLQGLKTSYGIPIRQIKGVFIEWAKAEGVYAKGLGLLDDGDVWSVLG